MKSKSSFSINLNIFAVDLVLFLYVLGSSAFVGKSQLAQELIRGADLPIILILLVCIFFSKMKFTLAQIISLAVGAIIVLITYLHTGYSEFLRGMLLLFVVRSCDYKELFNSMRKTIVMSILIILGLYVLGYSNAGILRRGALSNATVLGLCVMLITFMSLAIAPEMKILQRMILLGINTVVFLLSGSRTACALSVFAVLISMIDLDRLFNHKWIKALIFVLPLLFLLLSYITAELYPTNRFIQMLDPITNFRISLNYRNIHLAGITPFGSNIGFISKIKIFYNSVTSQYSDYNTIDSSYTMSLIEMGIVSTAVWLSIYFTTVKKFFNHHKSIMILVSALLSFYGLFESSILNFTVMFPFLTLLNKFEDDADWSER
jgi:hypothetical protein